VHSTPGDVSSVGAVTPPSSARQHDPAGQKLPRRVGEALRVGSALVGRLLHTGRLLRRGRRVGEDGSTAAAPASRSAPNPSLHCDRASRGGVRTLHQLRWAYAACSRPRREASGEAGGRGQAGGGAIGASRGSGSTTCRSWRGARWGATTHRAGTPHSLLVHLPTHAGVPATKQELVCAGTRRGRSSRRVAATGLCAGSDVELTRWACGVWEARGAPARAGRC
jgi:hypothetical protein